MTVRAAGNNSDPQTIVAPTGLEFQITDTKLYVPVVTLSKESDTKLLEQLKSEFKRIVKWNKYRSQMTVQISNNNLNYLIDPIFTKVKIEENNVKKDHRDSFSHYYAPNSEIKNFNVLIDWKSFSDLPVKNEEEIYQKIIEMSGNNGYTTINLLDFKENYRLIEIDLSQQTKLKDLQQVNFIGKLVKQAHEATMFFIIEKSEETTFELFQNSVSILSKWRWKKL